MTGAGGFVGGALLAELACSARSARLAAIDASLPDDLPAGVERLEGDLASGTFLDTVFSSPFDAFVHLAAIPGGAAEKDYEASWRINVDASANLLSRLAAQKNTPRFVFASSIGVYGVPLPTGTVTDDTYPLPTMSYGTQKLVIETLVTDLARRGSVDGLAVRLPGIIARPRVKGGHLSAFMSEILHALQAGEPFACPVSSEATSWFMSRPRCVANLMHALRLPAADLPARRAFNLPALRLSMKELVEGAATHFGASVTSLVQYGRDEALEAQFGSYPPIETRIADGLGFRNDGDASSLVANALGLQSKAAKEAQQ